MAWWHRFISERTDDEITARIAAMVKRGEIQPHMAVHYERALRDEAEGRSITMTSLARSVPKPKPPRSPGQQGAARRGRW